MRSKTQAVAAFAVIAAEIVNPAGASADELADFFKRQPFTIIVGSTAGGSYDFYARAIARHIGTYLPGQPTVVVQNMPGGGGYLAANYIYTSAAKDGSTIATFSRSVPMQPLYDKTGVAFDPLKMAWIGSPSDETSLAIAWRSSPVKTFADLRQMGMTVASTGPGTDSNVYARVITNTFKLKTKIVTGYRGSTDMLLAAERGEVDGLLGVSWSSLWPVKKDAIESGSISFLAQLALEPKRDGLKGVPLILELAETESDRRLLEIVFARQAVAFPFTAPPGLPPARLQSISEAFARALADKELIGEVEAAGLSINPVGAAEMTAIIKRVYASDAELVERVKSVMAEPAGR